METELLNRQAVEQAVDQWNLGALEMCVRLYSDDVVLHGYAELEPGLRT